jgi:2-phospho-L-lactate guanylyltransferase
MALWAIVPVKPLRRNKSLLSGLLTEEERSELNHRLLVQTINTLKSTPQIENILVISKDDRALTVARDQGARTVLEPGDSRLNLSLARATIIAKTYSMQGVLILPADLPFLSKEDITVLLEKAKEPPVIVIVPDRYKQETNALLVCPAGLIDYEFGPGSFSRHCERARAVNVRLEICELPSMALNMNLPEDLKEIEEEFESLEL